MKKFLIGATVTAAVLSSCTKNDLIDGPNPGTNDGKIRFSATTKPTTTKAAQGNPYTSTNDLQGRAGNWGKFRVKGYFGSSAIVGTDTPNAPETVSFNGVSWEYGNNAEPYWPNGNMDFFAYANWPTGQEPEITTSGISTKTGGYDVVDDNLSAGGHQDLLVAASLNASKEVRTLLTFKHALTQIVFKAGNINPANIDVIINDVEIVNVAKSGNMKYEKPATPGNAPVIDWSVTALTSHQGTGYRVQGINDFAVPVIAAADANNYGKYHRIQTASDPANNALLLIPQTFEAWNPNSGSTALGTGQKDAYIRVSCIIKKAGLLPSNNVGLGIADADVAAYLYAGTLNGGSFDYDNIYIPVESKNNQAGKWEAGKRINYIITFGDNNSGSGGGGYDNNGDPILVPIRFRAVVEDWVEVNVPLLTATFEASSTTITHKFIDGYTNQLLNDIKAAAAPKVYQSAIVLKGSTSANIGNASTDAVNSNILGPNAVTFEELLDATKPGTKQNAKFRPGSTLSYGMWGVSNLESNPQSAVIAVPTGWSGQGYNREQNAAVGNVITTGNITLNGHTAGKIDSVVFTKLPTSGYSYICQVGFIEDNLAAVELNENYVASPGQFTNTVYVKGAIPTPNGATKPNHYLFSSDMLTKIVAGVYTGSTVKINMEEVTGWNTTAGTEVDITTWCPSGWTAQVGSTSYYPGDPIKLTSADSILFTKVAGVLAHNYKQYSFLSTWLASAPGNSEVFYYDNVDFNVEINNATFAGSTATAGATIYLKFPVTANKFTATGWSYTATGADAGKIVKD